MSSPRTSHLGMKGLVRRNAQSALFPRAVRIGLYVGLPAWLGPGLIDWWCHRRTDIERPENGGVAESLLHAGMLAEGGVPLLLGTFFEMNPFVVTLMASAAALHELTAVTDVWLAEHSDRRLTQTEQHTHSFLEVMPFAVSGFLVLIHQPMNRGWRLRRRKSALSPAALVTIASATAALGLLPYVEELSRCLRARPPRGAAISLRRDDDFSLRDRDDAGSTVPAVLPTA